MSEQTVRQQQAVALHLAIHPLRAQVTKLAREASQCGFSAAKRDLQAAATHLEAAIAYLAVEPPDLGEQLPLPSVDSDPPPSR